jgi:hypothetical protein
VLRAVVHNVDRRAALTVMLEVLALLGALPALQPLLPLPGAHRHTPVAVGDVDEKALGRVRALPAKAEATKFPEEALGCDRPVSDARGVQSMFHIRVTHGSRTSESAALFASISMKSRMVLAPNTIRCSVPYSPQRRSSSSGPRDSSRAAQVAESRR